MRVLSFLALWLPLVGARPRQHRPLDDDVGGDSGPAGPYVEEDAQKLDCKMMSFSAPRWSLYDPSVTIYDTSRGGTMGDIGFGVYSAMTGQSFQCVARNVNLAAPATPENDGWIDCSIPGTQFKFNLTDEMLSMRANWQCDNAPGITFSGHGEQEIPIALGCWDDETESVRHCLLGNLQIAPTLTAPMKLAPIPSWPPWILNQLPHNCPDRSDYPTWEVDQLVYDHSTYKESLKFGLKNLANNEKLSCSVAINQTLTRGTAHAERWVKCDGEDGGGVGLSGTEILFDADYRLFGIKQHWTCPEKAGDFTGTAYHFASGLNCRASSGSSVTLSAVSSKGDYSCTLPFSRVSGYSNFDLPPIMPHTSFVRSCTLNSVNATSLVLREFETDTAGGDSQASFTIYNPGSGDEYRFEGMPVHGDGNWHKCEAGTGLYPWQLQSCEYRLDGATQDIGFRFQWYCDDRDPYHPIMFDATAGGRLPEKDSSTVQLDVSSLTWASTGKPMDRGPSLPWV